MNDDVVGFKPPRNNFAHPSFKPWRFELLEYQPAILLLANGAQQSIGKVLTPTGRYGWITCWLQDGDADVAMDDGDPPHSVKWRQCRRVE